VRKLSFQEWLIFLENYRAYKYTYQRLGQAFDNVYNTTNAILNPDPYHMTDHYAKRCIEEYYINYAKIKPTK
jgi:hypothetical protein